MAEEQKTANPAGEQPKSDIKDIEDNKMIAALSYVWILFLIPLLGKRDSRFAQFHAKQGMVLFIIDVIGGLLFWFPVIGQLLLFALIIVSIIGIIKALNGERWEIPYIYDLSKKFKI